MPRAEWVIANALGEGAGIAAVALAYAAVDRAMLATGESSVILAGAWEGLCLGGAQAFALRRLGIRAPGWVARTVVAAALGYGLALLGGAGGGAGGPEPPLALIALAGAGLGLVMGAGMGAIQAWRAPAPFPRRAWLFANAIGWMPAMAVIMVAASAVPAGLSLQGIAVAGAASGMLAGMLLGLITGLALPRAESN